MVGAMFFKPIHMMAIGLIVCMMTSCGTGSDRSDAGQLPTPPPIAPTATSGCTDTAPMVDLSNAVTAQCNATDLTTKLSAGGQVRLSACNAPITLSQPIAVTSDTTFDAAGATISGGGSSQIFRVAKGKNFTIFNATLRDALNGTDDGGAVSGAQFGNLTVINVRFLGNTSSTVGGEDGGGAIYKAEGGKLTVFNSTFEGNTATNGGAIKALLTNVQIIDSAFFGNTARGGNNGGGAVIVDGLEPTLVPWYAPSGYTVNPYGKARICGALFKSNTVGGAYDFNNTGQQGGGLFTHTYPRAGPSLIELERSIFEANQSHSDGGAMRFGDGTVRVKNVIATGNTATNGGAVRFSNAVTASLSNTALIGNCATPTGVPCTQGYGSSNNVPSIIGGAGAAYDGTVNLQRVTIARNSSHVYSGGLGGAGFERGTLTNSLIVGNVARGPYDNTHNCGNPMQSPSNSFEFPAAGGQSYDRGCGATPRDPSIAVIATACDSIAGSSLTRAAFTVFQPGSAIARVAGVPSAGVVCPNQTP